MAFLEADQKLIERTAAEVRGLISHGRCLAFVGSGPSRPYFPTWDELLRKLSSCCLPRRQQPRSLDSLTVDKKLALASKCRQRNLSEYRRCLQATFEASAIAVPQAYIMLLEMNFAGYLTINFDLFLHNEFLRARRVTGSTLGALWSYSGRNLPATELMTRSLFYLHGHVQPPPDELDVDNVVLCKEDFDQAYAPTSMLPALLTNAFTNYDVLFIGCGLTELPLQNALNNCKVIRNAILTRARRAASMPTVPRIIRLAPEGDTSTHEDLGIENLRYPKINADHAGLIEVFKRVLPPASPPQFQVGFER